MWADNETEIDLLGFDYLVDSLEIILTEPRLLPVTVGVTGDWGSGKSSLMQMSAARLDTGENRGRYIRVLFSPWRFEDYAHVKVALMAAVVDAIADYVEADEGRVKRAGKALQRVRARLDDLKLWKYVGTGGALVAGASPDDAAAAGHVAEAAGALGPDLTASTHRRAFETVAHFHVEFEELVEELGDEIRAVVVFIDDMDRCTTPTIIETFVAIRLFLHAPKTAYVIGAHEEIVEAALEGRYPARKEGDEGIGRNYLEKMLQNSIAIPPLSEPEAQTYINLLFAELYTSTEQFARLRAAAAKHRSYNQLAVAMNEGIATDTIGDLPAGLTTSLELAARIGPPLARGLRGNPRQLKRYLNTLQLRLRTADKRSMELDPGKLAKLMVLERLHPTDFEMLFHWQLESDGSPAQLVTAEKAARGDAVGKDQTEVKAWAMQPGIREWLLLDPPLAGETLAPYFTLSRDQLKTTAHAARLPAELQQLLVKLQSEVGPTREKALQDAAKLEPGPLTELVPVLIESATAALGGPAAKSLVALAKEDQTVAAAMFGALEKVPVRKVTVNFALLLRLEHKDDPRLAHLLERWALHGSPALKRAIAQGRR